MNAGHDKEYWEARSAERGQGADGYTDPLVESFELRLRWAAFDRLCPVGPGERVLDAGCGTGRWSRALAARGCLVVGADLSEGMIAKAEPAARVRFVAGPLSALSEPSGTFDLALSVTTLQHITEESELTATLANLRRLIRTGGRLFLLEYSPDHRRISEPSVGYLRGRTWAEWVALLRDTGFRPASETGVRHLTPAYQLGYGVYRAFRATVRRRQFEAPSDNSGRLAMAATDALFAVEKQLAKLPWLAGLADVHAGVFIREAAI